MYKHAYIYGKKRLLSVLGGHRDVKHWPKNYYESEITGANSEKNWGRRRRILYFAVAFVQTHRPSNLQRNGEKKDVKRR